MCSAKELDKLNEEFRSFSVPQELNNAKTSQTFEELNEADEEDEDECEEDDEMPGYSDETNMDTVRVMKKVQGRVMESDDF